MCIGLCLQSAELYVFDSAVETIGCPGNENKSMLQTNLIRRDPDEVGHR